jgi:hypothetical protein
MSEINDELKRLGNLVALIKEKIDPEERINEAKKQEVEISKLGRSIFEELHKSESTVSASNAAFAATIGESIKSMEAEGVFLTTSGMLIPLLADLSNVTRGVDPNEYKRSTDKVQNADLPEGGV